MKKISYKEGVVVVIALVIVAFFIPALWSSVTQSTDTNTTSSVEGQMDESGTPSIRTEAVLDLEVEDIIVGTGAEAEIGDTLYVHYVGLLEDGTTFDTSTGNSQPYMLTLGAGDVITGWDLGLIGMQENGTRRLVIPSELAYGSDGVVNSDGTVIIPPDAVLTFDIVLLKVVKGN